MAAQPAVKSDTGVKAAGPSIVLGKDAAYSIAIIVLAVLLVLSLLTSGFGVVKPRCPEVVQQNCTNASTNETAYLQLPQTLSEAPLMGSASSAVTVLEFSDFQCPFCGIAFGSPWAGAYASQYGPMLGTVKKLEAEYVDTGRIAFRHFPVAFLGEESSYASNAALCAGAQGKYWEMHDAIYAAQTPEENSGKYNKANLKSMAQGVGGLDMAAFSSCVDSDTYAGEVEALTSDWNTVSYANSGRAGTPLFYVVLDASKASEADVSAAAEDAGYQWGKTPDNRYYVVIASPEYPVLKGFIDSVAHSQG